MIAAPQLSSAELARELGDLIAALTRLYAGLLSQVESHRDALARADGRAVEAASRAQADILAEIARLEPRRAALVNAAAASPAIRSRLAQGTITLRALAGAALEPDRTRLVRDAEALRGLVQRVQDHTRTMKAATASLIAHMEGLMRQVARRLSHAGTYGGRGLVEASPAVVSAIDVRT